MSAPNDLLYRLLHAHTEDDVTAIVQSDRVLAHPQNWTPYGGPEHAGTFQTQQDNAVGALGDKIVNSIDAVLLAECKARGVDPEGPAAPPTMQQAVELFFGVRGGDFSEISQKKRRQLAEMIHVAADGPRPPDRPNILVVDRGEGQRPQDFEDTLLSLHRGNKVRIPFVQGKYNMGGTGALPFCGNMKYQLIVSQRRPDLLTTPEDNNWGFSLVRRHFAGPGDRVSWFEYCVAPTGAIMTAPGEDLEVYRGLTLPFGTVIKLFGYDLPTKSNATLELWRELNRHLHFPALPFVVEELRGYPGHSASKIVLGNKMRIMVDERDSVDEQFPPILPIEVDLGQFGRRTVEVTLFKEGGRPSEFTTPSQALFFTINGQTHATLSRSFVENRAKLGYLSSSLLVHVDCTDIDVNVRDDVMMGSRDRMRDNQSWREIQTILADELRGHEALKAANRVRQEHQISRGQRDIKFLETIVARLLRGNSTLATYLKLGGRILDKSRPGPVPIDRFDGKRFPTFLQLKRQPSNGTRPHQKQIPLNSYVYLKLETDAANDYLSRDVDPGQLLVAPDWRRSSRLWNGIVTLKLTPPSGAKVGDVVPITAELTRPYDASLKVHFELLVARPVQPRRDGGSDALTGPAGGSFALPEPTLVYRDRRDGCKAWADMTPPWTGQDVAKVVPVEDEVDIYINMDADALADFLRQHRLSSTRQDVFRQWYKASIYLYSLVFYNDLSDEERLEVFPAALKSVSKIILDLLFGSLVDAGSSEHDSEAVPLQAPSL